jgi:hypothetical protein
VGLRVPENRDSAVNPEAFDQVIDEAITLVDSICNDKTHLNKE